MKKVTYLFHSGFLVELEQVCLLFDWWKSELPPLPEGKPLLVFASHRHHDHFDRRIFTLADGTRTVRYLLGSDIRNSDVPNALKEVSFRLHGGQTLQLQEATVETLLSTDEGVAFYVTCGDTAVFHAGDLNWWHWEGEPDPWNPDMERRFKQYMEPLRGRAPDLAFMPLDKRLEHAEGWGMDYFLSLCDARRVFPMHQWEDFASTDRFLQTHPSAEGRIVPVRSDGQRWEFCD